jgi:hypothetical protein
MKIDPRLLVPLLAVSCAVSDRDEGKTALPEETHEVERQPDLRAVGALAVPQGASVAPDFSVELVPELILGEATGASFGSSVLRLAVDSKGMIYVGDWMNSCVWMFDPGGTSLGATGRRGQGPGEFQAVHGVDVGRGDSLFVFDANSRRLSAFAPGTPPELAYTLRIPTEQGHPFRLFVPTIWNDGFLFAFQQVGAGTIQVHRVDGRGEVDARAILVGKDNERVERVGPGSVARTSPLFARGYMLGLTPASELFYGWSEFVDLTFFDLEGRQKAIFRAVAEPIPVRAADIQHELAGADEAARSILGDAQHHSTKPALKSTVVDDNGWIWLERFTEDPGVSEWWVSTREIGVPSARFRLPDHVRIQIIRGGRAYAVSVDPDGYPTVVRFRVEARRS